MEIWIISLKNILICFNYLWIKFKSNKKNIFLESNSPLLILKAMHRIRVIIVKGMEFFVIP